jgi:DNA-binding transcriptional MerR regulator
MTNPDPEDFLTAAECAARTALTVRALRVYEEYELIAPRRSAGGWRLYGPAELVRLNTIAVLKSAGLSLAEIKAMANVHNAGPPLQEVLNMQLESLQCRKADIERGQSIVAAALRTLKNHESLPIDELCNLIRSIEMNEPASIPVAIEPIQPEVIVDTDTLDRYVGYYQLSENSIITITRDGNNLYSQPIGNTPSQLTPESTTEFFSSRANATLTFLPDAHGKITSLGFQADNYTMTAIRIDSVLAETIRRKLTERIQSQTPVPGSEAMLRRMLDSIACNQPNYDDMNPAFANLMRKHLPQFHAGAMYLGSIQSIEFKGVGSRGWDVYEVKRERGTSRWRIAVESSGIITGAMGIVIDMPISAGP